MIFKRHLDEVQSTYSFLKCCLSFKTLVFLLSVTLNFLLRTSVTLQTQIMSHQITTFTQLLYLSTIFEYFHLLVNYILAANIMFLYLT